MTDLDNKEICTFQEISDFFNLNNRQDSSNYFSKFEKSGYDFGAYLIRKNKLGAALPLIQEQILGNCELPISEHLRIYNKEHPELMSSNGGFRNLVKDIDALKLYNQCRKLLKNKAEEPEKKICEEDVSNILCKRIDPSLASSSDDNNWKMYNLNRNLPFYNKAFLSLYLLSCGTNMSVVGNILGVAKSTVSDWIYKLPDLKKMLLNSIKSWSGVVCMDEKWLKINGKWHYVFSVVDHYTGFPLYYKTVGAQNTDTWEAFMSEFKKIYGKPKLIISDGSLALAAARRKVFPEISFQYCWFHKLKNLNKRIYQVKDEKLREKLLKMSDGMFHNRHPSSRKRTAQRIVAMNVPGVSKYVEKNILGNWRHLNKMLTSNAAERWNRKINKVMLGRYGLKSVKFVDKLLEGLVIREAMNNQKHLRKGFITNLNIAKICQANINSVQILDFLKAKLFESVA
jgi:transposase-like protein